MAGMRPCLVAKRGFSFLGEQKRRVFLLAVFVKWEEKRIFATEQ